MSTVLLPAVPPNRQLGGARKRPAAYEAWKQKVRPAAKAEQVDLQVDEEPPQGCPLGLRNGHLKVGTILESIGCAIMRQDENLESARIKRLPGRCRVEVIALGCASDSRRVCVRDDEGTEGWVSFAKENGDLLWLQDGFIQRGTTMFAAEDGVRVFYDAESYQIIFTLSRGERVSVNGLPVNDNHFTMLPVQLVNGAVGAVQYDLLRHRKPVPRASNPVSLERPSTGPLALELVYSVHGPECVEGWSDGNRDASTMPRLVVYGDSLAAHVPSESCPSYAYGLREALSRRGIEVQMLGCGLPGLTAVSLAAASEERVLRDNRIVAIPITGGYSLLHRVTRPVFACLIVSYGSC